jgi:acyl-CoA synthetase (AMP-forming)/AMP-acid ligase II
MFGNLAEMIAHNARRRSDHPAMIEGDRTLDYQSLDRLVSQTANWLRELGVKEGDFTGLALGDTIDHVVVMFAIMRLGAVIIPMDCRWTDDEKIRVAKGFNVPKVIVDDAPLAGITTLVVDEQWHRSVDEAEMGGHFPSNPDAPLWLSLSSGTTGTPKGPLVTHQQMSVRFISQWVTDGFNEHDRHLLATPLYFGGGRSFTVGYLLIGGTVVFHPPPYQAATLVETVERDRISTLFLVPTLLRRLLELPADGGPLFPNLRILLSSGSILHPEERDKVLRNLSPNFFNLYASTEGGAISILPPDITGERANSVGRAAFQTEFEVVDQNDKSQPPNEVGRIRHRSPWLPDGFYENEEETRKYFKDGWYYPGDLGKVSEDGFLYIVGRAKDMIIRGGINVYPAEVEEVLLRHAAVHDAAVVPWASKEFGEEVAAFVVLDHAVEEVELIDHCRTSLASYKTPKQIFFLDELPKSALGKILKPKLVESLQAMDDIVR